MDKIAIFTRLTSNSTTRVCYFLKQDVDRKEWKRVVGKVANGPQAILTEMATSMAESAR